MKTREVSRNRQIVLWNQRHALFRPKDMAVKELQKPAHYQVDDA